MYFDQPYYIEINQARWQMAARVLDALPGIQTCIDAGCGPGWFSDRLVDRGLTVLGIDGRPELVEVAAQRVPRARFATADITASDIAGRFSASDLVFCFGLLYHLENPFAAIRNLERLTKDILFIETQVAPGDGATFVLVAEGQNETQGLQYHAVIPSRHAAVKMLYVSGFQFVYRYTGRVEHADFMDTPERRHRREIFIASKAGVLSLDDFVLEPVPSAPKINYSKQ